MTRALERETFRAMGTICAVAATAESRDVFLARSALDAARREVAACELALSRFDASSDLSRLNGAEGAWVAVDARLIDALCSRAPRAHRHVRAVRPDDPPGARRRRLRPLLRAAHGATGHAAPRLAGRRAHRRSTEGRVGRASSGGPPST